MTGLTVADLVLVASRVLDLDTEATLDLTDLPAAEQALADADPDQVPPGEPARPAAALLHALLRHQPFRHGNQEVALVATLQFLTVNGWDADLDPPEGARVLLEELAAGTLNQADFTTWLASRVHPAGLSGTHRKEAFMPNWLPDPRKLIQPATKRLRTNRFTDRARQAVARAQDEARALSHNYVGTEHQLLGLLGDSDSLAARALVPLGVSAQAVREQVVEIIGRGAAVPTGEIPFTPRAKKVQELALREALRLGHNYVGTEHQLLALLREGQGVAAQVLVKLGADHDRVREQVQRLLSDLPHARFPRPDGGDLTPPLELLEDDQQIAETRRRKDAALDEGDHEQAASLRAAEKDLLARRAQRQQEWLASLPAAELAEENRRLRALLRRHGIEPDEGTSRSA